MPMDPCQRLCSLAQTKFEEMDRRWDLAHRSLIQAIEKSEGLLAVRLEDMNNFRRQIQEERTSYTTRRETVLLNVVISLVIAVVTMGIAHVVFGK